MSTIKLLALVYFSTKIILYLSGIFFIFNFWYFNRIVYGHTELESQQFMKLTSSMNSNMITGARFGCISKNLTVSNLLLIMCTFDVPL